jgi:hypothetical protein
MSAAGQKKGIFGEVRAKTGQWRRPAWWFGPVPVRNPVGAIGRVSAASIGVMSLALKACWCDFGKPAAAMPVLSGPIHHDFVIDSQWRNKLKDRPN